MAGIRKDVGDSKDLSKATNRAYFKQDLQLQKNMAIGQLTRQLHILHCTFRFYNCTNCDQLHVKIFPGHKDTHDLLDTCIKQPVILQRGDVAFEGEEKTKA